MTELREGDVVEARPHVAGLAGTRGVVERLRPPTPGGRQRPVVRWDGRTVGLEVPPSGLRLVARAGPRPEPVRAGRDPGVPLPGGAGRYLIIFASGEEREARGTTQLDAALVASRERDAELRAARRTKVRKEDEDETPPRDRALRTVLLEVNAEVEE